MKLASDLRKALDEALKPDSSGKTTPIQRLTPFLRELMQHLEENETAMLSLIHAIPAIEARIPNEQFDNVTVRGHLDEQGSFVSDSIEKSSSEPGAQAVPALPTNETGSASKATA